MSTLPSVNQLSILHDLLRSARSKAKLLNIQRKCRVTLLTLTKKFHDRRSRAVLRQYLVSVTRFLRSPVSLTLVTLTEEVNWK